MPLQTSLHTRCMVPVYPLTKGLTQTWLRELVARAVDRWAEASDDFLPDWLRAYLRFDGEAVLRDFEAAGDFWVYDAPQGDGCFVFDPYERPAP